GIGSANGKEVVVQQGSIVRNIPKVEVLFVGETRNDVYHYMRDRVPANDEVARLAVARWCMFNGLREQALAEAKEILQFKPGSKNAADMARSLEESLKQFPSEGAANASKQQEVKSVNAAESDIEITPEAATTFATRVQPILANVCLDCHARSDHAGAFKLTRVTGYEGGPQTSLANLRATVGQLLKSDPSSSPLLTKAITAHGGLREPPFKSRQAPGFVAIENWVILAVGTGSGAPVSGNPIGVPNAPPTQPAVVSSPIGGLPPTQPTVPALPAGLPPVEPAPALPISNPTVPPSASIPAIPSVPVAPTAVTVPPVLPTPPMMKPTVPTQPPIMPSADHTPGLPSLPMVPPSSTTTIPSVPNGNQPAIGTSSGSQFGTDAPPKPMPPGGPTGRDEFDPGSFNQGVPRK
ncbi:MAG TPA: hypothetical protein VG097_08080, partial [Gemmata sp.]|nr:hypothetical protein [Gemmata sp.]